MTGYYLPKIRNVSVERVGKNLQIKATRSYCPSFTPLESDDAVTNWCEIKFQYREIPSTTFSDWVTILERDAESNDVDYTTGTLNLDDDKSYEVVVGAFDRTNEYALTIVVVTASGVFMERDGELNSISIGEAVTEANTVAVAPNISVKVKGPMEVKQISCYGTLYLGETLADMAVLTNRMISMRGDILGYFSVNLPLTESDDSYFGIEHADAGYIDVRCAPDQYDEEGNLITKRNVRLVIGAQRLFEGGPIKEEKELKIGIWTENLWDEGESVHIPVERVMVSGLTAPFRGSDAVNKMYLDDELTHLRLQLESMLSGWNGRISSLEELVTSLTYRIQAIENRLGS